MTTTWGIIDAENLWITAQKYALPSVSYKHREELSNDKRDQLIELMRRYPLVLRDMVRRAVKECCGADDEPSLAAIALFHNMKDDKAIGPSTPIRIDESFASAGFEILNPGGNSIPNRCDTFVVAEAMRLLLTKAAADNANLIIGTSDHYAAGLVQIALSEPKKPRVFILGFRHNTGKYWSQTQQFLRTYPEKGIYADKPSDAAAGTKLVHVYHELDDQFQEFASECSRADEWHATRWQTIDPVERLMATMLKRLTYVEYKPTIDEFKRSWMASALKAWHTYETKIARLKKTMPYPGYAYCDEIYAVLNDRGLVTEQHGRVRMGKTELVAKLKEAREKREMDEFDRYYHVLGT